MIPGGLFLPELFLLLFRCFNRDWISCWNSSSFSRDYLPDLPQRIPKRSLRDLGGFICHVLGSLLDFQGFFSCFLRILWDLYGILGILSHFHGYFGILLEIFFCLLIGFLGSLLIFWNTFGDFQGLFGIFIGFQGFFFPFYQIFWDLC